PMCTGKRQTHIRNAPSSRTAVTGIDPTALADFEEEPCIDKCIVARKKSRIQRKILLLAAIGRGCVRGFIHSAEKSCFFVSACFFRRNPL
ncbi:MAG: hypothetical protein UD575_00330, partial [Oscillospiraceae bacterium]|nr:hypothetical protein [Oscillospiraceae bacterium]